MKAEKLYQNLEKDFDLAHCKDDWSQMDFNDFISDNFKQRYMGLLADNSKEIKKVYTAVFPSKEVINIILESGERDALLFVHHPMVWDINNEEGPFKNTDKGLLQKLKEKRISIYNLHTSLDRIGEYSTCVTLANAIQLENQKGFYEYFGHYAGIIGDTEMKNIKQLVEKIKSAVGHEVKLWQYGSDEINNQKVGVIGGGGTDIKALRELDEKGINTFVTGVTRPSKDFQPALEAHSFAEEKGINMIGATHYSTEKFACIAMVDYFKKLGLEAEFITDKPDFNDMDYGMR